MKSILTILVYINFVNIAFSQDINQIDSIGMEICSSIKLNQTLDDNRLIQLINEAHLSEYLRDSNNINEDSILDRILLRTEKLCPEYSALAYRTNDNYGDWVLLDRKPKTNLDSELCNEFFTNCNFYYLEPNGDKVELEIKDEIWTDRFMDKTYSKLKLIVNSNCEFSIQFIESNNSMRNKFSRKGDLYNYQILDFKENKYFMAVEIPGQEQYYQFILYLNE